MTSIVARVVRQVRALAMVNTQFLTRTEFRTRASELAGAYSPAKLAQSIRIAENDQADASSRVYEGLTDASLALALPRLAPIPRRLNLVVPEVREGAVFAGVATALEVATGLARRLGLELRIVMIVPGNDDAAGARALVRDRFGTDADVVPRKDLRSATFGDDDLWMATHWTTAHALQVMSRLERVDPDRVIYLIQDYEAGFNPWSTEFALARDTYRAGFIPFVNSTPLARHLRLADGLDVDDDLVFGPAFDLDVLQRTHSARRPGHDVKVLFYARPSKPRNLYRLGLSSLRVAVRDLGDDREGVTFVSACESHRRLPLGYGKTLESVGTLPWSDYFDLLATSQVVLSLQHSPHPSHPPFDAAISGAIAITNEFNGERQGFHESLVAVPADADSLGRALADSVRRVREEGPRPFSPLPDSRLGGPLAAALDRLAERVG